MVVFLSYNRQKGKKRKRSMLRNSTEFLKMCLLTLHSGEGGKS